MTWWRWDMSAGCAQIDMVGVGDKHSGLRAFEGVWWRWETSGCARIDMVEVADELLGSKRCGGGRRRAIALKLTLGVGHERTDSN